MKYTTINEAIEPFFLWQKKIGARPKTIKNDRYYVAALTKSVGGITLMGLKKADVSKVIEAGRLQGKYGAQRAVVIYRKVLRYLKESSHELPLRWQDIKVPPVAQAKVEYLTEDELERVLGAINLKAPSGLRTRTLLEVLYATGMRIGEAISVNRSDIDWRNKEAVVINVKSREPEKVYFSDRSLYWLRRYLRTRRDKNPALFVSQGERLTRNVSHGCLRRELKRVAAGLGIRKKINHHIFRKTFVTHLLQRKADIMAVKDLARHRSERTTLQNYAGVDKERSKTIHADIMNKLLP